MHISYLSLDSPYPAARKGGLIALLSEHQSAGVPIQMLYPSNKQRSLKIRSFVDFVAEKAATMGGLGETDAA
ncbi:hypothetical protein CO614_07520 [Lysobacteraceae bacterium NML120232]|nr:hypothetical protein CO614_07520 [Xanthomonadaceae bacterium NML120232]